MAANREKVVVAMIGTERALRQQVEAQLREEVKRRTDLEGKLAQALVDIAAAQAGGAAERQARERAEGALERERFARVGAETARAVAETTIVARDADIARLAQGPAPVIQMVKEQTPWDFTVVRDGAQEFVGMKATPRKAE